MAPATTRLRLRLASALALALLPAATGCWPVVPIAAMVRANQSSGRHHETPTTVTLSGTIVTNSTVLPPKPPSPPPTGPGPSLDLSASEVDFGVTGGNLVVQALNAGDGTLTLDPLAPPTPTVGADANWLTAELLADGKTIALTIDRTTEPDGAYQARVDVSSNGGTGSFLVDATVQTDGTVTPIGPVIIEVRDEQDLLVATVTTTVQEGYAWTIPDLPRGRYFLAAGVDLDSNGSIGDPGEPFGGYPGGAVLVLLEADQLDSIALDILVQ